MASLLHLTFQPNGLDAIIIRFLLNDKAVDT
jgi:hypothetical protein